MAKKDEKNTHRNGDMFEDRRKEQVPIEPETERRRKKKFDANSDWYLKVGINTTKKD